MQYIFKDMIVSLYRYDRMADLGRWYQEAVEAWLKKTTALPYVIGGLLHQYTLVLPPTHTQTHTYIEREGYIE